MKRVVGIIAVMLLYYTSFQVAVMQVQAKSSSLELHQTNHDFLLLSQETADISHQFNFAVQDTMAAPADSLPPDSVLSINSSALEPPDSVYVVDSVLKLAVSNSLFAPSYLFKPSPSKAVLYAAVFPGLGQIYNRKFWKLPIVYGGFVGFTYAITWNNGYYRDYLSGYQDIVDDNPETIRWHKMLPYGMLPETVDTSWFTDVLQQRKDYYRYYRDLSIILTVGWYLLAMVDAYVDAQLFDFDMSTDLSLRVGPTIFRDDYSNFSKNSYGLQWSFQF